MRVGLFFDPATEADDARSAIKKLEAAFAVNTPNGAESAPSPAVAEAQSAEGLTSLAADAITLHQETNPHNRSRRLLEALTEKSLTFSELAPHLPPNDDGSPLSKTQARAVYRNLKRTENRLLEKGAITAPVVRANFDMYDHDAGGRYYLAKAAVAALDHLLGR